MTKKLKNILSTVHITYYTYILVNTYPVYVRRCTYRLNAEEIKY